MHEQTGMSRRGAIVALGSGLASAGLLLTGCSPTAATAPTPTESTTPMPQTTADETIVVYFSRAGENYYNGGRRTLATGNTKVLAQMLIDRLGCDSYEIQARDPYSTDYDATVQRNVEEENADARPAIAGTLPDLSRYRTVLLGSPVWNVRPSMIMHTFIDQVDWSGKTLNPFVTHAVSGLGSTVRQYRDAARGARLNSNGLAIRGEDVRDAEDRAATWLRTLGLTQQSATTTRTTGRLWP